MGSKTVTIIAIVVVAIAIIFDTATHGHFDDERIRELVTENVENQNEKGPATLHEFQAAVDDRTTWIKGSVDSAEERHQMTLAALRAPGILTLVNDLKVDHILEDLLRRLKLLVEADPTEGHLEYRIGKDGHTVTLDGWVPVGEEDLRQAIEDLVRDVPGVRKVINNMTIGPPVDTAAIEQMIVDILRLKNIYFDYNKATIRPESMDSIEKIAGIFQQYPTVRVRVEGHTDAIASEQYNQKLSEARAGSVKAALVQFGVEESRIDTVGHGESMPIAPNNTPEGRADNRRIEFKVSAGDFAGDAQPAAGPQ